MATNFKKTSEQTTVSSQHEAKVGAFNYNITVNKVNSKVENVTCSVIKKVVEEAPNPGGTPATAEREVMVGQIGLYNGNKSMSMPAGENSAAHVGVFEEFLGTL